MTTILVADDMPFCREPIAESLRGRGYHVLCAGDGAEVLSLLKSQIPDVILLDMVMPKLDGLAVLRTIRRNPEHANIPVLMLTDRSEPEKVQEAARYGIQGYLLKSQFSLNELFARVGACLGKAAAVATAPPKQAQATSYAKWRAKAELATPTLVGESRAKPSPAAPAPASGAHAAREKTGAPPATTDGSLDDLRPVITKAELFTLVNKGLELRPLGPTVQNVMAVTGNSRCSTDDVGKAVSHDQALSIRVLKLGNSSAYCRGRPAETVGEAVQRIGIQEVRSLVMALGVLEQFENASEAHLDPRLFWEHSIACGLAASAISKQLGHKKADDAFLWGMVHDVGRLILLDHVTEKYQHVRDAAEYYGHPLEAVEAKLMLLNHCDILERALEHWCFGRDFIVPVVSHHRSVATLHRLGPEHTQVATAVALADRLAHALLLGSSGNETLYPLDDLVDSLKLKPAVIAGLTRAIPDETRDLKFSMLARGQDGAWPDYVAQVRERFPAFRPLCVSAEPDVDAFRMFCDRLAPPGSDEPPNIGIVYLRAAAELASLRKSFNTEQGARRTPNLPVVVILAKGRLDANDPWLTNRPHAVLSTPVRIAALVETVKGLLGSE